ncbi:uncharacterized protein An14g05210 [Aspergillus niger]|uniref:Contig An14c0180, genomic contig n=2 Tax=Aspergillus niger TaxID=5061 RepID=A2R3R4_ASPNC|nr:uncharacterized protein An14g05210 [Aspergillus niger]CAK42082.1 unnamed protein product [Aspergillus niger]
MLPMDVDIHPPVCMSMQLVSYQLGPKVTKMVSNAFRLFASRVGFTTHPIPSLESPSTPF